jgi:PAS domain S-box-containing protein
MKTLMKQITNWNNEQLSMDDLLKQITGLAFCVTSETGHFIEVNEAYTKFYGYSESELLGKHFTMVVPEGYRQTASEIHDRFIKGENEMPTQWQVQRKDGKMVDIIAYAIRAKSPDGKEMKVTMLELLEPKA